MRNLLSYMFDRNRGTVGLGLYYWGRSGRRLGKMKEEAELCLRDAVAHAKRRVLEVDSKLCSGLDIRQEILSIAKQIPADLLVLSTHGCTGWEHLFFGSDTEKMVAHAPCPILVVR